MVRRENMSDCAEMSRTATLAGIRTKDTQTFTTLCAEHHLLDSPRCSNRLQGNAAHKLCSLSSLARVATYPRKRASGLCLLPLLIASGCTGIATASRPRVGFEEFQDLLRNEGFEALTIPRGDYRPGTIIEIGAQPGRGVTRATPEQVLGADWIAPPGDPAAWLQSWSRVSTVDRDVSLLKLLADPATPVDDEVIRMTLAESGVYEYVVYFKDATVEVLSEASVATRIQQMNSTCRRYLAQGSPIVLEALRVQGVELAFRDRTGRPVQLSGNLFQRLLRTGFELHTYEGQEGRMYVDEPLTIGIKPRVLSDLLSNAEAAALTIDSLFSENADSTESPTVALHQRYDMRALADIMPGGILLQHSDSRVLDGHEHLTCYHAEGLLSGHGAGASARLTMVAADRHLLHILVENRGIAGVPEAFIDGVWCFDGLGRLRARLAPGEKIEPGHQFLLDSFEVYEGEVVTLLVHGNDMINYKLPYEVHAAACWTVNNRRIVIPGR